jgi:ADP-heptose:LPS heptosyltransferase
MTQSNLDENLTVVIAHCGEGSHLESSFRDLIPWYKNIIVVGTKDSPFSQVVNESGGSWVDCDSNHIIELWEKGVQTRKSTWYLLIQGAEYLSTVLKESIVETVGTKRKETTFYTFARQNFFLKQRLKYTLEWTHDPSSALMFTPTYPTCLDELIKSSKTKPINGELIHFGEKTLSEVTQNSFHRADWLADQIYKKSPGLNKRSATVRAVTGFMKNFIATWLVRKGMREGYEGFVFCFMDSAVILLSYLRYFEKYIRSGQQIADHRDAIKKVLVIKVRGLGDAVLATPVLKNIKALMPNVSTSVLTFNFCKSLFEKNPNISEVYSVSGDPSSDELKQITNTLNEQKFDLIINLHSRNLSSRLTKNIKSRWKVSGSYFIRDKYTEVLVGSDHALDKTSIERDLDCLRSIGLTPIASEPELFTTDEEVQWAKEKLEELKVDSSKKLIMIHPACSQMHKNWGMEQFVEFSRRMINDCGHQVMGIFSQQEQSVADSLKEQVDGVFIYVGPIRPSMALIQQSDLMVDNCSGPSHISAALQVPTLVLMGVDFKNTYRDERIYKNKHFLFFQEVPCRDLFLSKCLPPDPCENRICMDHPVAEVIAKAQKLLEQ